ncbi:hypothetical protein KKG31_01460 [Patescibacteria group bacterium]|nr:hypothetical protein [Patescibacteria group bacterium]MBU1757845.1 hypothetical protein [Patescibacteria group bacterium]
MFLKKYQPLTYLMSSFFRDKKAQASFKNQIIIKPIRANGGKGIKLTTVVDLLKQKKKYE